MSLKTSEAMLVGGDPMNPFYQYVGRIDFGNPDAPVLHYGGSYVVAAFRGASLRVVFSDEGGWNEAANQVGLVIDDGALLIHSLRKGEARQVVTVEGLPDGVHHVTLVKLQGPGNGRGGLTFHGLLTDARTTLVSSHPLPALKIEVYGDSITEGEGAGCPAGTNDCGQNNGWLSYANVLARHLCCQIQNVGVGGLAVRDGTGYYENGTVGLETIYNKLNPCGDHKTLWDFSRYQPDLVLMTVGVNDQSKDGFNDLSLWKRTYKAIVHDIHARYGGGDLPFLFAVPPVHVEDAYRNVAKLAEALRAEGVTTYFYRYGFEVGGHPNREEAARMAQELYDFILGCTELRALVEAKAGGR